MSKHNEDTSKAKAMDPSVREQTTPDKIARVGRDAYAVTTLIKEVTSLFPETTYETSGANAFNTRLVVAFDDGPPMLTSLLLLVESDHRVLRVTHSDDLTGSQTVVEMHDSFRTQDSRDSFGLAQAHAILTDGGNITLDENDDFVVADPEGADDVDDSPEAAALWAENDARLAPDFVDGGLTAAVGDAPWTDEEFLASEAERDEAAERGFLA